MAPENKAPFRWPPQGCRRGSASRGGFFGSRSRRLRSGRAFFAFRRGLLLLAPATEVGISPKHHLERGVHHMIRRAGDERRVLLDGHRDWLLQLVLAFHHLWRFVDDRHVFSFLLLTRWPNGTRATHIVSRGFPSLVFARVQNQSSRHVQPQRSQ